MNKQTSSFICQVNLYYVTVGLKIISLVSVGVHCKFNMRPLGKLPYEKNEGAHQKFLKGPLRGTNIMF